MKIDMKYLVAGFLITMIASIPHYYSNPTWWILQLSVLGIIILIWGILGNQKKNKRTSQ